MCHKAVVVGCKSISQIIEAIWFSLVVYTHGSRGRHTHMCALYRWLLGVSVIESTQIITRSLVDSIQNNTVHHVFSRLLYTGLSGKAHKIRCSVSLACEVEFLSAHKLYPVR